MASDKSYYHEKATPVPIIMDTIPERVEKMAKDKPDKQAFVMFTKEDLTYDRPWLFYGTKTPFERYQMTRKEVNDRATNFAHALVKMGIKKGDLVAYCCPNIVDWFALDVGIMKAGAIAVHVPYRSCNVKTYLGGCTAAILDFRMDWDDIFMMGTIEKGGKINCKEFPMLKYGICVDFDKQPVNVPLADDMIKEIEKMSSKDSLKLPNLDAKETAFINVFPGGKSVKHTHFDALNCPCFLVGGSKITEDDVRYTGGYLASTSDYPFGYIQKGIKCVFGIPEHLREIQKCLDRIVKIWKEEGCTIISLEPPKLKYVKDFGFKVPLISSYGEFLTKSLIRQGLTFAERVVGIFDDAEALRMTQKIFTKENVNEHQYNLLGRATEGVEVKLIDEAKEIVPIGTVGRICVKSPWISKDFGEALQDGWIQTKNYALMLPGGDLCKVNA